MKCPNCGAEINNTDFCEFCGSQITTEMQKKQEQLNKNGCPKCGSTNIKFTREKLGETKSKKGTQVIRATTGICNDCGHTWHTNDTPKKRKTWLWVLGWIFMFPAPLSFLLLRKKNMNNILKYGIIAVAWIIYFIFVANNGGKNIDNNKHSTEVTSNNSITASTDSSEESQTSFSFELVAGKAGKYGKEIIMSKGTDMEEKLTVYYVPAGKYIVKNIGEYRTQVSVYEGFEKNAETGYDEYTDMGNIIVLDVNGEDEIEVPEGWFIEIHEPTHILLTAK